MARPNFVGIGAQKCASTWIFQILSDHPDVSLSTKKEIDYFSYRYHNGYQWYENHFPEKAGAKAIGEISPSYFHEPAVPSRLHSYMPDIRIILSLREPVERAISNHNHEVRIRHFMGDDISFEAGLKNNPMYIEQGMYAQHVSRWLQYFNKNQILVILMDDIKKQPEQVVTDIYNFLDIDSNHTPEFLRKKSNPGHLLKSTSIDKLKSKLRLGMKNFGLSRVWEVIAKSGLRNLYRHFNRIESDVLIPSVQEKTKQELHEIFSNDIKELEKMLDISLDKWK